MNMHSSSPALWPFLIALVLVIGSVVAVVSRKVPKRAGVPFGLFSLVLVAASLIFVKGEIVVATSWSIDEVRRPSLAANDVPFSDAQLADARIGAYKSLASFPGLVQWWADENHLKAGSMTVSEFRVTTTPTGVTLTTSVPLLTTFVEEKSMTARESFMQDLVHAQCQRNLVINELRRNGAAATSGGSAKIEHVVDGHCAAWAKAEFKGVFGTR